MSGPDLNAVARIFEEADAGTAVPQIDRDVLDGFSGEKLVAVLQRLTALYGGPQRHYVEIGVFQGLTLLSTAAANPGVRCFGIDNFSLFNEGRQNLAIVQQRMARLGIGNASVINEDYEEAFGHLADSIGKQGRIGVLFVDGPHDYRSQLMCLALAVPYLAEDAILLVDDSNYPHVRQANADFLRCFPEFALLFEAYTPAHPANLSGAAKEALLKGWWNGLNVMVRDRAGALPRAALPTGPKELYYRSHDVFRHEFAESAFELMRLNQSFLDQATAPDAALAAVRAALGRHRETYGRRYPHQNTYSEDLPRFRLHAPAKAGRPA